MYIQYGALICGILDSIQYITSPQYILWGEASKDAVYVQKIAIFIMSKET